VRGDQGNSITIDGKGNVYITGYTYSSNYPTTSGAFQTTFSGNPSESNVFITKINSSGSALVYSTFIGSGVGAYGTSIAIDANENAYITGWAVRVLSHNKRGLSRYYFIWRWSFYNKDKFNRQRFGLFFFNRRCLWKFNRNRCEREYLYNGICII